MELLERNVECYHLQSTPQLPAPVTGCFDPRPYDGSLGYLGDPAGAAEVLAAIGPDAVVAGSEWGVLFADELAWRLGLPGNRIRTARARRDKFEMIDAVARAGLRTARQIALASPDGAVQWAERHGRWPVVVKPLNSAGSDGVSICHSEADIRNAFAKALNRRNFMGEYNAQLLLQSYLDGPQYIVNTVSHRGRHIVTDAWHMTIETLPGSAIVANEVHLLDAAEPRARALIDYTLEVLSVLGIDNGAAHTELKWTADGPALIELGARLMGAAMDRPSYRAALQETQASAWAGLLASDDEAAEASVRRGHFVRRRALSKVFFSFSGAGVVRSVDGLRRLRELPSFHAHYRALQVGDRVWRTADTLACGGVVYLVHDDPKRIDADLRQLRAWERSGSLYDIAAFSTPDPVPA